MENNEDKIVLTLGAVEEEAKEEEVVQEPKTKDIDGVGDTLVDLVAELKNFQLDEEEKGISKWFKKGVNKVNNVQAKYESASKNVEKIVKILEDHQITLMKDIAILDQLYAKNLQNFKELTMYILAGYKKLDEIKATELPALQKKAAETGLA